MGLFSKERVANKSIFGEGSTFRIETGSTSGTITLSVTCGFEPDIIIIGTGASVTANVGLWERFVYIGDDVDSSLNVNELSLAIAGYGYRADSTTDGGSYRMIAYRQKVTTTSTGFSADLNPTTDGVAYDWIAIKL